MLDLKRLLKQKLISIEDYVAKARTLNAPEPENKQLDDEVDQRHLRRRPDELER